MIAAEIRPTTTTTVSAARLLAPGGLGVSHAPGCGGGDQRGWGVIQTTTIEALGIHVGDHVGWTPACDTYRVVSIRYYGPGQWAPYPVQLNRRHDHWQCDEPAVHLTLTRLPWPACEVDLEREYYIGPVIRQGG